MVIGCLCDTSFDAYSKKPRYFRRLQGFARLYWAEEVVMPVNNQAEKLFYFLGGILVFFRALHKCWGRFRGKAIGSIGECLF